MPKSSDLEHGDAMTAAKREARAKQQATTSDRPRPAASTAALPGDPPTEHELNAAPSANGVTLDYDPRDHDGGDDLPTDGDQPSAAAERSQPSVGDYLAGVTPAEVLRHWPREATKQGDEWQTQCPDRSHADRQPSAGLRWSASGLVWCCRSRQCHETHGGGLLGWVRAIEGLTSDDEAKAWLKRSDLPARRREPASTRPAEAAERASAAWAKRTDLAQHWAGDRLTEKQAEADALVLATGETMGLTADEARAWLRPAVVRTGNRPRLVVSLPACGYDGEVVNWKDWPQPTARSRERRPARGYDGALGYGREQWADGEPPAVVVFAEGETDGLTLRAALDAADDLPGGRWVAVAAQGAGKAADLARDLAAHCRRANLDLPTLLTATDGDDAGEKAAAQAVAAWQHDGGAAAAVRLPDKVRGDGEPVDLRRLLLAGDDERAKVLAALTDAAEQATSDGAAVVRYDGDDDAAVTLADLIVKAATNEANADDLAALNDQADRLLRQVDRRRATHAATRALGDSDALLAYNPHGGLWFKWADGRGGWRETDAAAMAMRAEAELAAAALTDPAAVDDDRVREVLKRATRRLGPPVGALDARKAHLASGRATTQLWNRLSGEPVDGVLFADGVLTLTAEQGEPLTSCADGLAVEPVTPDLLPDLPPLPASVDGLLDLAARVSTTDDLLREVAALAPQFHGVLTGYGLPDEHLTWLLAQLGRSLLAVVGVRPGLMLIVGPPGTGKGTLLTLLGELAGSQFTLPNGWADLAGQFGPNDLLGKRVTLMFDSPAVLTGADGKRGLGIGKQLVVGEPMRCETKFDPTTTTRRLLTTCWQAANELPSYPSLGEAKAWLPRTAYLRLARQVPDRDQNPDLPATLAAAEGDAITHLAVCAWLLLLTGATSEPADLAAERRTQLVSQQPLVERAVDAVVVVDAAGRYGNKELTAAVTQWADDEGLDEGDRSTLTSGRIAKAAKSLGAAKVDGERDRVRGQMFVGLRLRRELTLPVVSPPPDRPSDDDRPPMTDEQLADLPADSWLRDE